MKRIENNICAPQGFLATGIHVGIRRNSEKPDLSLIFSQTPASAAGVFTMNKVKAAPVLLSQKIIKKGLLQALIINSGNANACTGKLGMHHAKQMTAAAASALNIKAEAIAVASTGVIGVPLPIEKIISGIPLAVQKMNAHSGDLAARAIMTTDTFEKSIAIELDINNKKVRLGGIAKGSGMIHPNMATMLGFITTDAAIHPAVLQHALRLANQDSFNMISVDGDTSTNDMVIALANGMAKNALIDSVKHPDWPIFLEALTFICTYLSKEIVRDGEGATKLMEIQVNGALNKKQARIAARTISSSPLVKTAIFGEDANWGRIACALGYSGAKLNLKQLQIKVGSLFLFNNGTPEMFNEEKARELLQEKQINIYIDLGSGSASATAWGCDLSYDYIKINASYRS